MQNIQEMEIWHNIIEHAKMNWEQEKLLELIESSPMDQKQKGDQLLFYILAALASGESPNYIKQNIYNELKFHNCIVCKKKLNSILRDIQAQLADDIYATYLAFQMLEDGTKVKEVSKQIDKLYALPK